MDVLGFKLEEGVAFLGRVSEKPLNIIETFSAKANNEDFKSARILRVLEKDKSIELTVGYF